MKKSFLSFGVMWYLLSANTTFAFSHADTLRGSNGIGRSWWDIQHYNLSFKFDTLNKSITGSNTIRYAVLKTNVDSMQIDLQEPMVIDSVIQRNLKLKFTREENVYWITGTAKNQVINSTDSITVFFHGAPQIATNPPWDGGFTWTKDSLNRPWVAVSCQGLGASVWWPCKDAQWDEPENGVTSSYTLPKGMMCIGNGRLVQQYEKEAYNTYTWNVVSPINNYDVTFYIGNYTTWHDTIVGENGKLDLDYWVLDYNLPKAKAQFAIVPQMLHCFEYWFGPYPFYNDGYKLVEAPYLGMEHQSAVAYGNKYKMGYLGSDRSGTGIGLKFDYIIVHETGHEWFGNNITVKDVADEWVQEGITTYSESLFAECLLGKEAGKEFCKGEWNNIINARPIIGRYGVNNEGSNIYDKGAAIMHMVRTMTNDDEKFRMTLRYLGKQFYHNTVTTTDIENAIAKYTQLDLTTFFNQYLREAEIPKIEYYINKKKLYYRFSNTIDNFSVPVTIKCKDIEELVHPNNKWQSINWPDKHYNIKFDGNDYLIK